MKCKKRDIRPAKTSPCTGNDNGVSFEGKFSHSDTVGCGVNQDDVEVKSNEESWVRNVFKESGPDMVPEAAGAGM